MNPPDIEAAHTDLPIDVNSPTTGEIRIVIRQIKIRKAAGLDNIPTKALKPDIEVTTNMLYLLFKKICEEEQVPMDWKKGNFINIPKKELSKCENYRGITLLSIPGKVFNRLLLKRMKDVVDAQLRYQQAGFRKDRSCTDQIATLRIIVEWNSLIMRRHLTVYIGGRYGNFFDTTEFLRRLSILSGTHMTDYSARSCMEDS
ncbi:unnamed protein product [Schistosoma curassoni]|uniref:Reverse transcriptase domain-containing protein n=1 Tax=Schistosoma curassoni TaxID=6186 RepID=A0A183JY80_9TREM|nr:unnamed protein product [Schistosoma curassoni]